MSRHVLSAAILLVFLAGCDEARPTTGGPKPVPGTYAESGAFSPFYGEELHKDNGRIYLFGTKPAYRTFKTSGEINELKTKVFIGIGPNGESVVAETEKDLPQMTDRLVARFKERYGIAD